MTSKNQESMMSDEETNSLIERMKFLKVESEEHVIEMILSGMKLISVPQTEYPHEIEDDEKHYIKYINKTENIMERIVNLLKQVSKSEVYFSRKHLKSITLSGLNVCGSFGGAHAWNNETIRDFSNELLKELLAINKCSCLRELLEGNEKASFEDGLIKPFLKFLRPQLMAESWRKIPSSKYVFAWVLKYIHHPNMYEIFPEVLPPSLMIADDHVLRNKVLGVKCLHHIIRNVNPSDLRLYGRADVIFDALFHLLHTNEADLIYVLYPCILEILPVVNEDPNKPKEPQFKRNKYDKVFQHLLNDMQLQSQLVLRRALSVFLEPFITVMRISVVRHLKNLMKVIFEYVEVFDGPTETTRKNVLIALKCVIRETWPRMPVHMETILQNLLKFTYDIQTSRTTTPKSVNDDLLSIVADCLKFLREVDKNKFEELCVPLMTCDILPIKEILLTVDSELGCKLKT